jgi:hypothetical protein
MLHDDLVSFELHDMWLQAFAPQVYARNSTNPVSSTADNWWWTRKRLSRGRTHPLVQHFATKNKSGGMASVELRVHSRGSGIRQLLRLPRLPQPENVGNNEPSECRDILPTNSLPRTEGPTRPFTNDDEWM